MKRFRLPGTPKPHRYFGGAGGVQLAADTFGNPNHSPVLLLHGGGQTRHAWKGTGQALASAGYFAVAYDSRGHGDSSWAPKANYAYETMVEDLKCLCDQLECDDPVVVGASMGGMVALSAIGGEFADKGLQLNASALVMVDIAPDFEEEGSQRVLAFMRKNLDGFGSLEEVSEAISAYSPQRPRRRNLDGLAKNVRRGEDGRYYWHWDPNYLGQPRQFNLDSRRQRLRACARALQLPVLLVRGGLSDVLSEEGAQGFLRLCPSAEYKNVTGAAHMVAGDRNDIFTSVVADFLKRTLPVR